MDITPRLFKKILENNKKENSKLEKFTTQMINKITNNLDNFNYNVSQIYMRPIIF